MTVARPEGERSDAAALAADVAGAVESVLQRWESGGPASQGLALLIREALPALVRGLVAEYGTFSAGDGATVPQALQRALQGVGAACLSGVWRLQGRGRVPPLEQRPSCPQCGRRMKLVAAARVRHVLSRFGRYPLTRPYYTCGDCGGGLAPDDAAWGQGPGLLDPELTQLLAANGCGESFQGAVQTLEAHLFVSVDDNEAERTTEAMGFVALQNSERRAAAGTCRLPPDPGSDIVLLEVDGGRVFAGGEWREPRLAAAAPLGPEMENEPPEVRPDAAPAGGPPGPEREKQTGRPRYRTGAALYVADIADADTFFGRDVRQLAEDAGLYHARVHTVVGLGDGGDWIEPRWRTLDLPQRIRFVSILDVRHLEEHVWTAAKAVWGERHPKTRAWATAQVREVRERGPQPLLDTLARMRPRRTQGREEVRKLAAYVQRNAHRLDYPRFVAEHFPIGSGLIEGGMKAVVNARAKAAGMRWSVPGVRAVLRLRALARSGPAAWADFWRTRPQLARPRAVDLPGGGKKVA